MTKRINQLISGALVLTIAGIISKVLSAMYRIPLQNLTGDLGFYTYQQVYPIIATVMILSLYGFPLAVSRLTAEQLTAGRTLSYRSYFLPIFIILLLINGTIALGLYILAPGLANLMYDKYLTDALQLSALLFLLIPFLALFRGVFQAELQMKETAYSQIIEQIIRVTIIIVCAWFIFYGRFDVRSIAQLGVISSIAGMMFAIIVFAIFFIRRYPLNDFKASLNKRIDWRGYTITIVTFGVIAAANHLTLIFIQLIDVLTLVPQLIKSGMTPLQAMEEKGIFDRGIPLIQFGAVLGSSFALAFVPSITQQNTIEQKRSIRDAIAVSVYVAAGATIGLIVIYDEVNRLLFKDALGTSVLQILALSILLLSLSITGSAILQAYGYVRWTVTALIGSLIIKILLNYMLTPLLGTHGSALATVASLLCLTLLTIGGIYRHIRFSPWKQFRPLPFVGASIAMVVYLVMVKLLFPSEQLTRSSLLIYVILLVGSGALIYGIILLKYRAIDERQIQSLPLSGKLLTLQKFLNKKFLTRFK